MCRKMLQAWTEWMSRQNHGLTLDHQRQEDMDMLQF